MPPSCVQRIRCILNGKTLTWNNEVCGEFLGVMSEVKMTTFLTITKAAWKYPEGQKQPHHIFQRGGVEVSITAVEPWGPGQGL